MKKIFLCFLILMLVIFITPNLVEASTIPNGSLNETNNYEVNPVIIEKCPNETLIQIKKIKNNFILILMLLSLAGTIIVINSLVKNIKLLRKMNADLKTK